MAANIVLTLHGLYVEISTSHDYPDNIDDLTKRAQEALAFGIALAKENNIDITLKNVWVDEEEYEED
tara:strand:- start:235 stop:435 length:201 start_codon:yes stop_codon:yes gene_type:complete